MTANKRKYTKSVIESIYSNRCFYCNRKLTDGNRAVDHLCPVSKGGKNTFENLVMCCKTCNSIKGNKTIGETIAQLQNDLNWCHDDVKRRRRLERYIHDFTHAKDLIITIKNINSKT